MKEHVLSRSHTIIVERYKITTLIKREKFLSYLQKHITDFFLKITLIFSERYRY